MSQLSSKHYRAARPVPEVPLNAAPIVPFVPLIGLPVSKSSPESAVL